ncbi:MAG: 6,7-dimethyl-8-ribityllumazine synthase [Bacteroidales bacterium]
MATELNVNNTPFTCGITKGLNLKIAIVVTEWNSHITNALRDGAVETLSGADYNNIDIFYVPGAVELTFAASQLISSNKYDAVIVFGCVIRGGTPHFDYVCDSVTQGVTHLNTIYSTPVIFGVLTVDNEQQALDRAGGVLGNKGSEAAETAIKMCDFILKLQ